MNQIKAILGATSLCTGMIVGSMLLLASGTSFGEDTDPALIDGAHTCTVASEDTDASNGDKFLSLRNSCMHDVTVNYRYQNRDGCQFKEVPLAARTPAIPFREANNARVCIEYTERTHQLASGYDFCGDLPARCAQANHFEVVELKYSPFMDLILSTDNLDIPEGQRGVFGISLSHQPTEPVQIAISHPTGTDISLERYLVILDKASWNEPTLIAVGTRHDEDDINDIITVNIDASGGGYSDLDKSLRITILDDENFTPRPPGVSAGTDPRSLDIKAAVLAIPPTSAPDQSTVRIHCLDENAGCAVFFDCTAQDGSVFDGWYLSRIPARGTHSLSAQDIVDLTGQSWEGKGRLACDLRSEMDIVAQIWTRSGEDILINNSAAIISRWTNEDSAGGAYLNECFDDVKEVMDEALQKVGVIEDKDDPNYPGYPEYPLVVDRVNKIDDDFRMCRSVLMDGFCTSIARCEAMVADSDEQNKCYREYIGDEYSCGPKPMDSPTAQDIEDHDECIKTEGVDRVINALGYNFTLDATNSGGKQSLYNNQRKICCSRIERCEADAAGITDLNIRYLADIGHLPSPDSSDISNIRIRCAAPDDEHCTFTTLECSEDDGRALDAVSLGTIERHHVRHIQAEELADLLDYRWVDMGLSCRVKSDAPFSVQVLTRTGGEALVNNSGGL
ncbi:MAG: hypothetical protein ISN28_01580 [Ectothiorhodospiraceae bacterium AqS1]|nr:hypothetical protein [Ectothiorhodospiraceae bacterium AqS1]